jgi:uncharacterized membrane protein
MARTRNSGYLLAAAFGAIAGMRSMAAPALLSGRLAEVAKAPDSTAERLLASRKAARALTALAVGEAVIDKIPGTPDRISPPLLLGRALTGALAGAALASFQGRRSTPGALAGAIGAVASSYAMFYLRQRVDRRVQLPDAAIGVLEDGLVMGLGRRLLRATY